MSDFLGRLNSADLSALCSLVLFFIAGMIVWLSLQWRLHRRTEMEIALKRDMVNRGMSAQDIERVLRAGPASGARADEPAKD
jgi:hypothetical protein